MIIHGGKFAYQSQKYVIQAEHIVIIVDWSSRYYSDCELLILLGDLSWELESGFLVCRDLHGKGRNVRKKGANFEIL